MSRSRARLGVNVDHIATVRQARRATYPDPIEAALIAERAGADQITVHLREDRRHIQDRDVTLLRQLAKSEMNLEMAATQEMVKVALDVRPDVVTFVPERRQEVTTEGGLDAVGQASVLKPMIKLLREADIRVSLFIDADVDQVKAAHRLDAHAVELHTGRYAEARAGAARSKELDRLVDGAKLGHKLGLFVAAGHGLHYTNTHAVAAIGEISELNIGHALVARATMDGMDRAVRDMLAIMAAARL